MPASLVEREQRQLEAVRERLVRLLGKVKARRVDFYRNRDRRLPRRAFEGSRVHGERQAIPLKRLIQDLAQLVRRLRFTCAPAAALAFALLPQPFFGALRLGET